MTIDKEILKVVEKTLPKVHAQALGDYFKKADQTEKDLAFATAKVKQLTEEKRILAELVEKAGDLTNRSEVLDKREKDVAKAEAEQRLKDVELKCEKEKTILTVDLFKTVFQNRTLRTSVLQKHDQVIPPNEYNSCGSTQPVEAETKTEAEEVT